MVYEEILILIYRSLQLSQVLGGGFAILVVSLYWVDFQFGQRKRWVDVIELHDNRTGEMVAISLLILIIIWGLTGVFGFWSRLIDGMVVWLQAIDGSISLTSSISMMLFFVTGALTFAFLTQAYKRSAKTFGTIFIGSLVSTWTGMI